jgi:hypothetical protein
MLLVDTKVLLDVATNDLLWADWSQRQLGALALHRQRIINPVVYAELSTGFARIAEL